MKQMSPFAKAVLLTPLLWCLPLTVEHAKGQSKGYLPAPALMLDKTEKLPLVPTNVAVLDELVYVTGGGDSGDKLLQIAADTLQIANDTALPFAPQDIAVSFNGSFIYVVGATDEASMVLVLDDQLQIRSSISVEEKVAYPSISLAQEHVLLLSGMVDGSTNGALIAVDVADPENPKLLPELVPDDYEIFGASSAWLDNREPKTFFLNVALLPTLVAFAEETVVNRRGVASTTVVEYDDITFESKAEVIEPLAAFGVVPGRLCRPGDEGAYFLLASSRQNSLTLAGFDPDFKSFDILSVVKTSIAATTSVERETFADTTIVRPTAFLESSCDQGVIWLADQRSREIRQFSVNPELLSLEQVGNIRLAHSPSAIAINTIGSAAYVLVSDERTISRFQSGDGELIGSDKKRTVQRLLTERGFPVGAIDGRFGAKTYTAIKRFEESYDVKLDINRKIDEAISVIENVKVK